jgi:hypothetical protein
VSNGPAPPKASNSDLVQIAILRKKIDALEAKLKARNQEISMLNSRLAVCRGQLRQQIAAPIPASNP